MGSAEAASFMFCKRCGSLLRFENPSVTTCSLCKFQTDTLEFRGKELWFNIDAETLRRHLNLEPFVKISDSEEVDEIQQRATISEDCPNCKHPILEYYTRQLRSADEGQTVFKECPKCHHKSTENS